METNELIADRGKDYGHPYSNYTRLAEMVSGCFKHKLKEPLTGQDCIMIMQLVKVCREAWVHKQDNIDDLAGYCKVQDMFNEREDGQF